MPSVDSPLVGMAVSSLPEAVRIKYLASKILDLYGHVTIFDRVDVRKRIREIVSPMSTKGRVKKTILAVLAEIRRQNVIRNLRVDAQPQTYLRRDKYDRMSALAASILGRLDPEAPEEPYCSDFIRTPDRHLHILLATSVYTSGGARILTRHPNNIWTVVKIPAKGVKIEHLLTELSGRMVPRAALLSGASVALDLCHAVFAVTYADLRKEEIVFGEARVEECP